MDRPETMPTGSGSADTMAADSPDSVEQHRGTDGGPILHQAANSKLQALRAAVQEGLDSGVSDRTIPVIMEEVEARLRDEDRL